MGACAGRSDRPAVVVVKSKNKPTHQTNSENKTAFEEYDDEPQISQINQSDPQQKPENPHPHQQDPQPQVQNNPPEERPVQKAPEKVFVSPERHEEKYHKDHALEEADEEDFANQFNKKESPQAHNKGNHQEQSGGFMMNLPGGQVQNQQKHNFYTQENHFEESKQYESKSKEKNVRDIINNPDSLEHSMASPGTGYNKALDQKHQDEFDAVLDDKQTHPHHAQNHQQRQSHFGTESQGNMNKEGGNKIESASPMSNVLQNRGSAAEKEKPAHQESPVRVYKEKDMKMSDSVDKMGSPEKIQMMRQSLEKMPWERNSVVRQEDENEIEFFDDELEASKE